MAFEWTEFIGRYRTEVIEEWAHRLHTEVNQQYAQRPLKELLGTVAQALDANCAVIIRGDYGPIDQFINKISRMRLAGGFSVDDVLKAFELFRTVILPKLYEETTREEFYECLLKVSECLNYTNHCFIVFFEALHKQEMLEYMRRLEEDVEARTSELLASELKYKSLIEDINDGYVILQDEVIIFVNPAFCDMHEFSREEMLGKRFEHFVDPRDHKRMIGLYRGDEPSKSVSPPVEYLRLTRSGKSLPTEITVKSTCYGRDRSTIGICRDIAERVAMAAKVREAERMAYIGRITTSLSHEIRNPLSSLKMNLQILKRNLNLQGNDGRRLDISMRAMERLEGILEQLLDFAKPLRLNRTASNLNRLLPMCVELLENRFEEHNVSVHLHLDAAMPEILADSDKLERAIVNLLLNALEASESRGYINVTSRFDMGESPPVVEFSVANQGTIPDEVLPDLFKPFFTTKLNGTGLGLTNVNRVVRAHAGSVSVDTSNRNETVFRVRLPAGDLNGHDIDR